MNPNPHKIESKDTPAPSSKTYLTLPQQPIYDSHFCGNLLASPTLDVHPYYLWLALPMCVNNENDIVKISQIDKFKSYVFQNRLI